MVELCEFSGLLVCFIITGSIIIRNLYVYFKKNYNQQRHSMLAALLLTILSLVVLLLRYTLEFVYNGQQVQIDPDQTDEQKTKISITACFLIIIISDLLPIMTQMLCIWISSKGKWDSLISGFLHAPSEESLTTYAGSVILDPLRAELADDPYDFLHHGSQYTGYRTSVLFETGEFVDSSGRVHFDPDQS